MGDKTNIEICKYFKIGDVIKDADDGVWGDKLFEIYSFHGNGYCPLASAYLLGKEKNNNNMCNFKVTRIRLINSYNRPMKKFNKMLLIKLMRKNNIDAKREFKIRVNSKKL